MKYIFMSVFVVVISLRAVACDVCGGSSGNYLGILPQYNKHFIGLSYQHQSFISTHPQMAGELYPVQSQNNVNSVTAWGRFYPFKNVQLFAFIPYSYNTAVEPSETVVMQGLGDIKIQLNYMLANTQDSNSRPVKHILLIGGGIKAPTGKSNYINSEGIILSNMQPGTGSWDFIANANYTLRYGNTGLNADASYKIPTVNKRDYRYGDRLNVGLAAFYWYDAGELSLLPQAGIKYEWSQIDYSSYHYRIHNPYSGGMQTYFSIGTGLYFKSFVVNALCNIPLSNRYAAGLVKAETRYEIQFQYLF